MVLPRDSRETIAQMAVAEPYILHRGGPNAGQLRGNQAGYGRDIDSHHHSADPVAIAPIGFAELMGNEGHGQSIEHGIEYDDGPIENPGAIRERPSYFVNRHSVIASYEPE
jgi:hypothetical protein